MIIHLRLNLLNRLNHLNRVFSSSRVFNQTVVQHNDIALEHSAGKGRAHQAVALLASTYGMLSRML
jgi:hypothetical protein